MSIYLLLPAKALTFGKYRIPGLPLRFVQVLNLAQLQRCEPNSTVLPDLSLSKYNAFFPAGVVFVISLWWLTCSMLAIHLVPSQKFMRRSFTNVFLDDNCYVPYRFLSTSNSSECMIRLLQTTSKTQGGITSALQYPS